MHPFCPKEKQGRANRQQKTTLPSPETTAALLATLFPIEPLCTAFRSPFQRCFSHTYPPLIHDVPVIIFHHVPVPTDTWPPVSQVPSSRGYEPSLKSHPPSIQRVSLYLELSSCLPGQRDSRITRLMAWSCSVSKFASQPLEGQPPCESGSSLFHRGFHRCQTHHGSLGLVADDILRTRFL